VGRAGAGAPGGRAGARVLITEIDPRCALQTCMEGIQEVTLESVVGDLGGFTSATGNFNIKKNAIVGNSGHVDNEANMASPEKCEGIKGKNVMPQVDRVVLPDGHAAIVFAFGRLLNLGCATGHPSFVMTCSVTSQVPAQFDLPMNFLRAGPTHCTTVPAARPAGLTTS